MKIANFCLAACVFLSYCSSQNNSPNTNNLQKLVTQYFNHFNQHQFKEMASMYADSSWFKDPSLGTQKVLQSRQQTVEKYTAMQQAIPNIHDSIVALYPSGNNTITVEFISTGTTSDSNTFSLPICTIFKFKNGLITDDYTYYDNMP